MARILLIDDDFDIRHLIQVTLENEGHEVVPTESGAEGLSLINKGNIDLVITDMVMPDVDGNEVVKGMKRHNPDLPIIAMTGKGLFEQKRHAENTTMLGANHVVVKSNPPDDLMAAVQSCVEELEAKDESEN